MLNALSAKMVFSIIVMIALGGLGAVFTSNSINDWYATLTQPPGTPPNWVFGPVWSTLYAMIGASFALIWHRGSLGENRPTVCFGTQLILNLAWSPVFFGARQIGAALIVIILLWIAIALTIRAFAGLSKPAAFLLIPYLIWVSYATYLNAGHFYLN